MLNAFSYGFCFFIAASLFFVCKRGLRYLLYFQQEGYASRRFLNWLWQKKAFDKKGSAALLLTALIFLFLPKLGFFLGAFFFLYLGFFEMNPLKEGKLKLALTERARRISLAWLILYFPFQVGACFLTPYFFLIAQGALIQSTPFFLIAAVSLLSFDERRRQKKFIEEAVARLKDVSPYIIGITGSYGKTSTKNALAIILQSTLGSVFWPKKGVNTEMGITREIRTGLKKQTEYAVIEMGAYGKGSIAKLCRLAPPSAGIITTIGVAHLDRFGDQETIYQAKSELAQAIPFDGILICNGDNEGARQIAKEYPKKHGLLYGFDNSKMDLDCWIKNVSVSSKGSSFVIRWREKDYLGFTSLVGRMALSNLAASFAMACSLGACPELVIGALSNLKSVDNRLQLYVDGEVSFLKDAYNSNPEGFSDALDVLALFEKQRKILMTPGMIELGVLEKELHEKIGKKAGGICDFAIVVGETNRDSLARGLLSGGMAKESILFVNERDQAFSQLKSLLKPSDVVLIENDLPDLYKDQIKF